MILIFFFFCLLLTFSGEKKLRPEQRSGTKTRSENSECGVSTQIDRRNHLFFFKIDIFESKSVRRTIQLS